MTIKEYQRKAMRTATPKCYNTANIEKLERRYPDGFSPAASVNREENNE